MQSSTPPQQAGHPAQPAAAAGQPAGQAGAVEDDEEDVAVDEVVEVEPELEQIFETVAAMEREKVRLCVQEVCCGAGVKLLLLACMQLINVIWLCWGRMCLSVLAAVRTRVLVLCICCCPRNRYSGNSSTAAHVAQ